MYNGTSIVDYLNSIGRPSDYATRANLATANGITNYTGTAQQNSQLLSALRSPTSTTSPVTSPSTTSPTIATGATWTPLGPDGKPIQYDPTGGTDYPTSPEQKAAWQAAWPNQVGEFGTYSVYNGNIYTPSDTQLLQSLISQTSPTPQINLPQTGPGTPGVNGIDGMLAYYKNIIEQNQKQAQYDAEQAKALASSPDKQKERSLLDTLLNRPTKQQTIQTATAQSNLPQLQANVQASLAEIDSLNTQYNNLVAARDQQIAKTQDKLAPMSFISNQVAQINRNAAPLINQASAQLAAKAAVLQVQQGQIADAQKYINQMVDAVSADTKDIYDNYVLFRQNNLEIYNNLKSDYRDALDRATGAAEKAWTLVQDQATKVGQLMLDNPQAGIDPYDTLQQALEKVQRTPRAEKPTITGSASGGYEQTVYDPKTNSYVTKPLNPTPTPQPSSTPIKLTSSQVNNGAVNAGTDVNTFKSLPGDVQNFFVNAPTKAIKAMQDEIAKVKNGQMNANDVILEIESSTLAPAVKDYFKGLIGTTTPQQAQPGILSQVWSGIKSFFGR